MGTAVPWTVGIAVPRAARRAGAECERACEARRGTPREPAFRVARTLRSAGRVQGTAKSRLSGAEWRINLSGDGFVRDHRVNGVAVLPGVAYLDFAVRAARSELGVARVALEQVALVAPLCLERGEETTLSVSLTRGRGDRVWFEVVSDSRDRGSVEHASGSLRVAVGETVASHMDVAWLAGRCPATIGRDRLYPGHERQPIQYGPSFRSVEWARTNGEEVFASVALTDLTREDVDHVLHPALLDGALQALATVLEGDSSSALYVPFAFGSVRPLAALPTRTLVYGRRTKAAGNGGAELLRGDIRVCDEDGRIVVELDDVALKRVPPGRPMTERETPTEPQGTIEEGRDA